MTTKRPLLLYLHGFLGHSNELDFLIGNHDLYDVYGVPWDMFVNEGGHESCVDVAIAIKKYLDKKDIHDAYLYGYSMGGRLAMQLVSLYPNKWKGLILESAHVGFKNGIQRRREQVEWEKRVLHLTNASTNDFLNRWYDQPMFRRSKTLIKAANWNQKKSYDINHIRKWAISLQTANQIYFIPVIKEWNNPVLYIAGDEDEKYKRLGIKIKGMINHANSVIIKTSDHNSHLCKPNIIKKEINKFIRNLEKEKLRDIIKQ